MLREAGDPETEVPKWLQTYTPLGIKCPIIPSGVFPEIEAKGDGPAPVTTTEKVEGGSKVKLGKGILAPY